MTYGRLALCCGSRPARRVTSYVKIFQIDAATGESETFGSVLKRSVQCANALQKMGLQRGDVMVLMAPNHIHLCVPYYAALYLGIVIAPIDRTLTVSEYKARPINLLTWILIIYVAELTPNRVNGKPDQRSV